uniref:Uncharacterized protein n=1 Tax=Ananas comosus var. bracteatus TaxID=296719 RepID=A0A6V7NYS1_ANACO|nr:unnamed protein product [Ananas comosus var. bracteatus]
MAEYRDEYGNRVPVVDQYGNPVSRVDEHGNPIRRDPTGTGGYGSMAATAATERAAATATEGGGHETTKERHGIVLHRSGSSSSSSSSSSEDDGQGGRRKKKKSLKDKIKEKLPGGHKNVDEHHQPTPTTATGEHGVAHTAPGATTTAATATAEGHHEKKGFMEKIKEKLPGHH